MTSKNKKCLLIQLKSKKSSNKNRRNSWESQWRSLKTNSKLLLIKIKMKKKCPNQTKSKILMRKWKMTDRHSSISKSSLDSSDSRWTQRWSKGSMRRLSVKTMILFKVLFPLTRSSKIKWNQQKFQGLLWQQMKIQAKSTVKSRSR